MQQKKIYQSKEENLSLQFKICNYLAPIIECRVFWGAREVFCNKQPEVVVFITLRQILRSQIAGTETGCVKLHFAQMILYIKKNRFNLHLFFTSESECFLCELSFTSMTFQFMSFVFFFVVFLSSCYVYGKNFPVYCFSFGHSHFLYRYFDFFYVIIFAYFFYYCLLRNFFLAQLLT